MTDPTPLIFNTAPNDDEDRPAGATGAAPPSSHDVVAAKTTPAPFMIEE